MVAESLAGKIGSASSMLSFVAKYFFLKHPYFFLNLHENSDPVYRSELGLHSFQGRENEDQHAKGNCWKVFFFLASNL